MQPKQRSILLSFDVEEFDLPTEYGNNISASEQMAVGLKGSLEMQKILDETDIRATLFTTANFAQHDPDLVKRLAAKHEIASHTFYHSTFEQEDLLRSRLVLEEISGQKIAGLRMPRFKEIPIDWVEKAGYVYDSSVHPTRIPGRYDNRHLPRVLYRQEGITRLPVSVTPTLRLPLFWLAFKNLPYRIFYRMALKTLAADGYLSLYFHPWEFTDISQYGLPRYLTTGCAENRLSEKLLRLISDLRNEADFVTITEFLKDKVV